MASTFKRVTGSASESGEVIMTAPSGAIITIIGLRAVNSDNEESHWVTLEVAGVKVSGAETPLPIGSGYEFTEGAKIVMEAGDSIVASSDEDSVVDVYVSYLEQT